MAIISVLDLSFAVLTLYLLKHILFGKSTRIRLPPGPPGLPIIKNTFELPLVKPWEKLTEWAQIYGDMYYLNVGGTSMIVLNSVDAATATLQHKSAIYSDRPKVPFLGELVGWDGSMVLLDDGVEWRDSRRIFEQYILSSAGLANCALTIEEKSCKLIRRVLDNPSPDDLRGHIYRFSTSLILDVTYGYQLKDSEDELMNLADSVMSDFSHASTPGMYLVDTMPWINKLPSWLPGMGYRQKAAKMRKTFMDFVNRPYNYARNCAKEGMGRPCMVGNNIPEDGELSAEEEHTLKYTAAMMFGGGADTTVSAIYAFFLFMTLNPDVQSKAQAEVDAVIGSARLPKLEDRPHLPYVDALVSEVFRAGFISAWGTPHKLRTEDIHDGYFIPKGSIAIPNFWAMSRDPRLYRNPEIFDPTRFLGKSPELDPRIWIFSFGRRICPGRRLADNSIFLVCAMALATLDISKATDSKGREIVPTIEFEGLVITHPKRFPCKIESRSRQAESLIKGGD